MFFLSYFNLYCVMLHTEFKVQLIEVSQVFLFGHNDPPAADMIQDLAIYGLSWYKAGSN